MPAETNRVTSSSPLILHRTSRDDMDAGVPVIVRGEGAYVFDREGNAYLDMDSGVTRPVAVGHGRREIADAVHEQICKLAYYSPCGFANEPALLLAATLSDLLPGAISKFTFECDGSEAVESAMKLARHHHHFRGETGRFKVISRRGAYHGVNGLGVRALGTVMAMRHILEPLQPGGVFVESPYCYRCPYGLSYPACEMRCARDVERIIQFEGPETVSAFIGEPVQQGFGALAPPPEYWPTVQEICRQYGTLVIVDEVICGFGRTGRMFGFEHFDLEPDLVTMAKCITSGYVPLGAVGCTAEIMAPIEIFMHLHTYGNHPVACAAALRNLELLRAEGLVEKSRDAGHYFLEGLRTLERHAIVGEARGKGLWTALDLTTDKKTRAPFPGDRLATLVKRAMAKGFIIKSMGQALEFAPPLVTPREEIDRVLNMLDQILAEEARAMGL